MENWTVLDDQGVSLTSFGSVPFAVACAPSAKARTKGSGHLTRSRAKACGRGHKFVDGSYRVNKYGDRVCRKCETIRSLKYYYRKKDG